MRFRRIPAVLTAAVMFSAIVLALSACGGGSSSSSSSSDGNTEGSGGTKPTKSTIKIGMANASTGIADGQQAAPNEGIAKAWEEWVNSEGGIQGHPVEVVIGDTKDENATAARVANEMIQEGVVAEVGGADSVSEEVWVSAFNKAEVPVIGGEIINPETIAKNPYFFALDVSAVYGIPLFADAAKAAGAKKIGMVLCSESAACTGAAELLSPRVEALGMEWAGYVGVAANEPTYTAACLAMQQKGVEFLQLAIPAETAVKVVPDCTQQGTEFSDYGIAYGGFDARSLVPLSEEGATFIGAMNAFPWFSETPAVKQYREVMEKFQPDAYYENAVQTSAWTAFQMFRQALENVKIGEKLTSAEVAEAMWQVKNDDLEGLLPKPVTFTKGKASVPMNCQFTGKLEDGKFSEPRAVCLKETAS